jgi:hypothetical protein
MPFISECSFQKSGSKCSKEDSVESPSQRSRIPRFHLDGPVMCPNAHQCLDILNSSRFHPSRCHGNTSGHSWEFDEKLDFLLRHRYGKTVAFVQTTGQHHPDAILDKKRRGEELQPSGRQGNTVHTQSLLWYLHVADVQPFGRGPDMVLHGARYGKLVA